AEEATARLNAQLAARLQQLQTIFDTAPVGINVAQDRECKVITSNRALAEMLGMKPGENVSKSRDDADSLPYKILKHGKEGAGEPPVEDDRGLARRLAHHPRQDRAPEAAAGPRAARQPGH